MARVIVIGGANVDIKGRVSGAYVAGSSNIGWVTQTAGGVGRNIAENLARLGIEVSLVTALGRDAPGEVVRSACAAAGVDLSLSLRSPEPTGTYLAVLDEQGELISAVNDMRAMESLTPVHLEAASTALRRAQMLVADCNLSSACLHWLRTFCAREGLRLLIEPVSVAKSQKLVSGSAADPVFCITPNGQQIEAMTGERGEKGVTSLHSLGFSNVVLHLSAAGAIASDGRGAIKVEAAPIARIADVTGAGDAAVAGLVFGLLQGQPLSEAARLGQCAAAIKLRSTESVAEGLSRDRLMELAIQTGSSHSKIRHAPT